jgi:hypothetical protein
MSTGKCGSLIDSAGETLVLAFKVAGETLLDSPETIQRILQNPKVRNAIESAATAQAKELIQKQQQGKKVTSADVKNSALAVAKKAGGPLQSVGLKELEKSATGSKEYKKLQRSLKELECSWKKSPVGVFVDKHKGFLYVVGAGLALQGAIVMYRFRSGDAITGPVTGLAQKLVKFKVLGNVEIAAREIKFVPSKREVGTKMVVTAKWQRVKVSFEAGVTLRGDTVTQSNAKAEVTVKVARGLSLSAHGGYQYQQTEPDAGWKNTHHYDLGLGLKYDNAFGSSRLSITTMFFATQDAEVTKLGGKAGVDLRIAGKPGSTSLKLNANAGANRAATRLPTLSGGGVRQTNEFVGKLGLSVDF